MKRNTIATTMALASVTAAGAQVLETWTQLVEGPLDYNRYTDVTTDAGGNIYYTGEVYSDVTGTDVFVRKVAADGVTVWSATWDNPASTNNYPSAIVVDSAGNVLVSGYAYQNGGTKFTLVKFDSDGAYLWDTEYAWHQGNVSGGLVVDDSGSAYVAGGTWPAGSDGAGLLVKYDAQGDLEWARTYDHPNGESEDFRHVGIDDAGFVYVAGREQASQFNPDSFVAKYDADGNQIWLSHFEYSTGQWDQIDAMAVDGAGNVYFTGLGRESGEDLDIVSGKFDTDGNLVWSDAHGGDGDFNEDWGRAITFDDAGNTYVAGDLATEGADDTVVIRYGAGGRVDWITVLGDELSDSIKSLAIDAAGHLSYAGETERIVGAFNGEGPPTEWRLFAGGLDAETGSESWQTVRLWSGLEEMTGYGIEALPGGSVLVAGDAWTLNGDGVIFAARYDIDCNGNGVFDGTDIAEGTSPDCNSNGVPDECDIASGASNDCDHDGVPDACAIAANPALDSDGTGILDSCEAIGDLDGSGEVSFTDLLVVLSNWGPCGDPCPADIDGDGVIGFSDLLLILANWG